MYFLRFAEPLLPECGVDICAELECLSVLPGRCHKQAPTRDCALYVDAQRYHTQCSVRRGRARAYCFRMWWPVCACCSNLHVDKPTGVIDIATAMPTLFWSTSGQAESTVCLPLPREVHFDCKLSSCHYGRTGQVGAYIVCGSQGFKGSSLCSPLRAGWVSRAWRWWMHPDAEPLQHGVYM
jgi:hypothetical protein